MSLFLLCKLKIEAVQMQCGIPGRERTIVEKPVESEHRLKFSILLALIYIIKYKIDLYWLSHFGKHTA
jgi:hypothetical protein